MEFFSLYFHFTKQEEESEILKCFEYCLKKKSIHEKEEEINYYCSEDK